MNASPYHSKVRVTLKFADDQFAAGGMVTGKMQLECKAEKGLGLGVIMVKLYAIEGVSLQSIPLQFHFILCPSVSILLHHRTPEPGCGKRSHEKHR